MVSHCPQTIAPPHVSPSYTIRLYLVASLMVARQLCLGLDYSVPISYKPGTPLLFKFGGLYLCGTHDALWAEEGEQASSHGG